MRLGSNGPTEIKMHPWFKNFDWAALDDYKMPSPFSIEKENEQGNFDKKTSDMEWKDMNEDSLKHCVELLE